MKIFNGKNILITGHTGFKGSWLSTWLSELGASVHGVSDRVPTNPSHFEMLNNVIASDNRIDVKDFDKISQIINKIKPDFLFHLAAQPLVLESYSNPLNTYQTNVVGTANILESLRLSNHQTIAIFITSDKAYDNVEWTYGYRENDKLGGKDPYSASKGCAELVIKSYFDSYFKSKSNISLAIGRAGNVIGGGDWAENRIIPDCIKSWSENKSPEIRNPSATRPWQHVLEPLSGYLTLALFLSENRNINGEAFNFGPPSKQNFSVENLINEMLVYWPGKKWLDTSKLNDAPYESGLLKLNCDKALHQLSWNPTLDFKETARFTSEWYKTYYFEGSQSALNLTKKNISDYMKLAKERQSFQMDI